MRIHTVEKPMMFKCQCGEQFIIGMWRKLERDSALVVRFLNKHTQFTCCPFCGGRMSGMSMEVEG